MSGTRENSELDSVLTDTQRASLTVISNLLIPPSRDGHLPGAAEYDIWEYICTAAPESMGLVSNELDTLDSCAQAHHGKSIAGLEHADAIALVDSLRKNEPSFMAELCTQIICCYYQQDHVLEAIGVGARAPFPEGYVVKSGDFSLLEPVRARGKIYREV